MRCSPRIGAGALIATVAAVALLGADKPDGRKTAPSSPIKKGDEILDDICEILASQSTKVRGVGLVIGLDNTGSDPEPSPERKKLEDEMLKAGIERPVEFLASKTCSMVYLTATIPPGVSPSDKFNVEISVSPTSTTTSLAGGYLLLADLAEMAIAKEELMAGQIQASVYGPVMTGTAAKPSDLRSGQILEGGRIKKDKPYTIVIREGRRSHLTATKIEKTINARFHGRQGVKQVGSANAKTPEVLELTVPKVYHQNQFRYFQIIRLLRLGANQPELVAEWTERWGHELLDPKTTGVAALQLEGIGLNTIPTLKMGLESPDAEVRFRSAEALAYLGDSSGMDVLVAAITTQPDYRIHSLTALAAMDQPGAVIRLRNLMSHPDFDVRYGAFTALRAVDPYNPYLGRTRLVGQTAVEEGDADDGDAMALKIGQRATRRRAGTPVDDPFHLYVVDSEGPPSIHVSKSRRCEIVLFGRDLELLTPVVLGGAGSLQINGSDGDHKVEISRIEPNRYRVADRKITTSTSLASVIRELVNLRATYPEVIGMLEAAAAQKNLPGPLAIDSLPRESGKYLDTQLAGTDSVKTKAVEPTRGPVSTKVDDQVKSTRMGGDPAPPEPSKGLRRLFPKPTLPRPSLNPLDWFKRPRTDP